MTDRLRHVEDLLSAIVGGQEGYANASTVAQSLRPAGSGDITLGRHSSGHYQQDDNMTNVWPAMHESTVDGMSSATFANESSSGYFGPSSNSAFIGHVARALASGAGTFSAGRDSSRDLTSNMSRPASPPLPSNRKDPDQVNPYRLPTRAEIVRLVDKFFSITGQFFPYISKTSVLQVVDDVEITMFSGVRKSWLCLLNAILAIGTSLDVDNARQRKFREAESDVFFQRALALSHMAPSSTDNLETGELDQAIGPNLNTILMVFYSASSCSHDSVPARHFQIHTNLEIAWPTRTGGFPGRGPRQRRLWKFVGFRAGISSEDLVYLHHSGQVALRAPLYSHFC